MSTYTAARQRLRERLYCDDPAKWRLWLLSPRAELAYAVDGAARGLQRVAGRIHPDLEPEDALNWYLIGQQAGRKRALLDLVESGATRA